MGKSDKPADVAVDRVAGSDAQNLLRTLRAKRLTEEPGHGDDTIAALEHAKRMRTALRIISTWASFPPLSEGQVKSACTDALRTRV